MTPRPERYSEAILRAVAKALLPDCLSHLGRKDDAYGEVESDVLDALAEAIPDGLDGYAIARHLDTEHGWSVTAALVARLNLASRMAAGLHSDAVIQWSFAECVLVPFKLDDLVTDGTITGRVTSTDHVMAECLVSTPEEYERILNYRPGSHGTVIPVENLRKVDG